MRQLKIDAFVIRSLMRDLVSHDKKPSAFLVFLYIYYAIEKEADDSVALSLNQLVGATGLSRSAVQSGLQTLLKRELLSAEKKTVTATPVYRIHKHW